jgi:hypothetical protein
MHGRKKWDYDIVDDGSGIYHLVDRPIEARPGLYRNTSN